MLPISSSSYTTPPDSIGEFLDCDQIRKYMKREKPRDILKKERRFNEFVEDPEGVSLGKDFDREVAMKIPSLQTIVDIFEELKKTKLGPSTKHLNRAIKYSDEQILPDIVTMILDSGVKCDEKSLENAREREVGSSDEARVKCSQVVAKLIAILHPETMGEGVKETTTVVFRGANNDFLEEPIYSLPPSAPLPSTRFSLSKL